MDDQTDRIEQIRSRRRGGRIYSSANNPQVQQQQTQAPQIRQNRVNKVSDVSGGAVAVPGMETSGPWLRDRVSLSLEAQIAMIEMRATHRLTLADMGYHNRLSSISIRPGIYLKIEPTGCYRMAYHNR